MTVKMPAGLRLEVEEIENRTKPGCGTSSTSPRCTCIPLIIGPKPSIDED